MKRMLMIAGLLMSSVPLAAQAASFGCHGAGQCVCTEVLNPKSVIGYNATADQESVSVNVTCINMSTMDVAYYTVRKEEGMGSYNGETPGR
ncbi:hypothetical protein DES32_2480 [Methylovirgula ligni]|uniref:Uncharacterized protein n=1 Tax=Methylovirgula ligni TaxID=569860 RepID=A0A3D9YW41_9HYPH|nr:hypothetical protein [Methylovirgula ligni]REF86428.1 hypothetical protein DES32_2480 [Methylovirgula ligni]